MTLPLFKGCPGAVAVHGHCGVAEPALGMHCVHCVCLQPLIQNTSASFWLYAERHSHIQANTQLFAKEHSSLAHADAMPPANAPRAWQLREQHEHKQVGPFCQEQPGACACMRHLKPKEP